VTAAFIPSPHQGVWHLGPLPVRAYALCIIAGVIVAIWMGEKRWVARGGRPGQVGDIAIWAIPFGLVGGRLYHVITDYELYFLPGRNPIAALYVWQGGLGIWGAIALGGLGAYIGCRRQRIKFPPLADALAPGIAVAQAIGRWGNWFNQELFGKPTTLPWGLQIDPAHRPAGYEKYATFQPTFLYECIWDLGVAGLVIWADRRFRLGHGRALALYVMAYTLGRGWIEYLRIDHANHILGLRLNDWTSILVFIGAALYFVISARRHPGREDSVFREPVTDEGPTTDAVPESEDASSSSTADASSSSTADSPAPEPDPGSR
jgi:prolipoprotein diacylglyceryl transferase